MNQQRQESKATVEEFRGEKGRKLLKVSSEAPAYQKEYFRMFKDRVTQGEPVVWKYIGTPEEIFKTMDVLDYDMQHYSALCSAKQMSRYYLDKLNQEGYFRDLCRYCTVPLGYAFDKNNDIAPWGGLPKFAAAVFIHNDDPAQKIWELYAREFNVPMYFIDLPYWSEVPPLKNGWGTWELHQIEEQRTNLLAEDLRGMVRFLETVTGKHLSGSRLREVCEKTYKMRVKYGEATNLAGETVPCPISWTDALSNTPIRIYHLGTDLGVNLSQRYYDEIKERVDKGLGACDKERVRLRYWGHPVWFSLGFYNTWEEKYGVTFLPCYYYEGSEFFFPDPPDLSDPIRTIAASLCRTMNTLRIPTTLLKEWQIHISRRYKADGVVLMVVESCKLLYASVLFSKEVLEKAGFPTLEINADMVDARDWDDTKMKSLVTSFVETLTS